MGRLVGKTRSLTIEASTSPCAHICRYCSIGDRDGKFPIERWMRLVERFQDWNGKDGPEGLHVQGGFAGPSFNFDLETFETLSRWYGRTVGHALKWIPLGGLKMRPPADMKYWLQERQAAGLEGVSAAFVGHGAVHDRWNGRQGDFDFLMQTLRTAAELGLQHGTTLFLTKSSLPLLQGLVELLDTLPTPHQGRHVRPFFYVGHGAHQDQERLAEEDLEILSSQLLHALEGNDVTLRSERQWIAAFRDGTDADDQLYLRLELTKRNIERVEKISCSEIFAEIDDRARRQLKMLPAIQELSDSYGDPKSRRLYSIHDVERLWCERFLERNPTSLDRSLLHYHLGKSQRPPTLWAMASDEASLAIA